MLSPSLFPGADGVAIAIFRISILTMVLMFGFWARRVRHSSYLEPFGGHAGSSRWHLPPTGFWAMPAAPVCTYPPAGSGIPRMELRLRRHGQGTPGEAGHGQAQTLSIA